MQYPVFIYNFATILFSFLHLIKQEKHMFRKLASVVESVICPHILRSLICFCLPSIDMCWPVERICGGYGFILASDKKCLFGRKARHVPRGSTVQRAPDCSPRIRIEVLNCWGYLFCLIKFMGNYALLAFWSLRSPIFLYPLHYVCEPVFSEWWSASCGLHRSSICSLVFFVVVNYVSNIELC